MLHVVRKNKFPGEIINIIIMHIIHEVIHSLTDNSPEPRGQCGGQQMHQGKSAQDWVSVYDDLSIKWQLLSWSIC